MLLGVDTYGGWLLLELLHFGENHGRHKVFVSLPPSGLCDISRDPVYSIFYHIQLLMNNGSSPHIRYGFPTPGISNNPDLRILYHCTHMMIRT